MKTCCKYWKTKGYLIRPHPHLGNISEIIVFCPEWGRIICWPTFWWNIWCKIPGTRWVDHFRHNYLKGWPR